MCMCVVYTGSAQVTRNFLSSKLWYLCMLMLKEQKRKRIIYAWFALYLKIVWMRRFWFEYYTSYFRLKAVPFQKCVHCTWFFSLFKIEEKRMRVEHTKEVDYMCIRAMNMKVIIILVIRALYFECPIPSPSF